MKESRLKRLKEILLGAESVPAEELAGYLDRVCGDDAGLRREAASLLAQVTRDALRTGGFDTAIREAVAALPEVPSEEHPTQIGPYRILGVLGHGGMGTVYRALQTAPIERQVALKLVRWGLDSHRILARFEAERRILGRMNHPGIARALDAGTSELGLPYFVMELVDGVPITAYCREKRLSPRACVTLFLEVCRAIQHAHQKGVLHRDLKPSNLLVTEIDGKPAVKVIDFGIAKALEEEDRGGTMMTREGQLLGTLEYMSPEQALGTNAALDTRSDVYALGVVLYELLTGRLPYDLKGLAAHEAARRIIEEPPSPLHGSHVSTSGVSRDLQVIVIKALDKDPETRYPTVAALAEDLELMLADQPIRARTPSTAYQLRKLISRHRGPFAFAATLLVLLVGFGITMSVLFAGQRRERQHAELEARKAQRITEFLTTMITAASPVDAGKETTIGDLLDTASAKLDTELVEEPEVRIALDEALSDAYEDVGRYDRSRSLLLSALATAENLYGLDDVRLSVLLDYLSTEEYYAGNLDQAEAYCRRCGEILGATPNVDPRRVASQLHNLAFLQYKRGKLDEAEASFRKALALREKVMGKDDDLTLLTVQGLGAVLLDRGDFQGCLEMKRRVSKVRMETLPAGHPWRNTVDLAEPEMLLGHYEIAESLFVENFKRIRASGNDTLVDGAHRLFWFGELYRDTGRLAEAESTMRRAETVLERHLKPDHLWLAEGRLKLARVLRLAGKLDEADSLCRMAEEPLAAGLGDSHWESSLPLEEEAEILMARSRPGEAEPLFRRSLEILSGTFHDDHWRVGRTRVRLAACLAAMGRSAEADSLLQAGMAHLDRFPDAERRRALAIAQQLHDSTPPAADDRTPSSAEGG
jgi:serine/threonine protein kinase